MTDSALNPAHYALSGGLSVLSVSQPGNLETFYVTVSGALTQGQAYTVTVNDMSDLLGNPIALDSQIFFSCTPPPLPIGNLVFRDLNNNGPRDDGEPGIDGAQIGSASWRR